MTTSNRRTFLKRIGQGTVAAGLGMSLPGQVFAEGKTGGTKTPQASLKQDETYPYEPLYGKQTEAEFDVIVVGGGTAGIWAAVGAARKGAKVALVEKGNPIRSGCVGSGVDHWQDAATNPASKVTPGDLAQDIFDSRHGYINGIARTIKCHESYDRLLDAEKMGMKVRDDEDEFVGSEFRDEKTKLLFAYNYEDKCTLRVWATGMKPALTRECKRLGVKIYDRFMGTSLLTENGRQGGRVIGVTAVGTRTGEFLVLRANAVVLCTARPMRVWQTIDTLGTSSHRPPVNSGDGMVMAWKAGAEFVMMEDSTPSLGLNPGVGMTVPQYGASWFPMSIVDSNGKEVPWVDAKGNPVTEFRRRNYPAPGQKRYIAGGAIHGDAEYDGPHPLQGGPGSKSEYAQPYYADLPGIPADERKAIFGLMIGQEGMTWVGYRNLIAAGFDRDKDMLQLYTDQSRQPNVRSTSLPGCGLVTDWNMRSTLPGLYAAGEQAFGTWGCAGGSTTGHYAGDKAAEYARQVQKLPLNRKQIEDEKKRVLAPALRTSGIYWKELENGIAKVMQDNCGDVKSQSQMLLGLKLIASIQQSEMENVHARNAHELLHSLEAINIATIAQMILEASLARKASNHFLGFTRSDFSKVDPPEWEKHITVKLAGDQVVVGELPLKYAGALAENYQKAKRGEVKS